MTPPTPTVEILVQHHPSRAARAAALVEALGGGVLVADPEPSGPRSSWRSYRACLEWPTTAPHRCLIQDDCVPSAPRLTSLLPRLASAEQITSLYVAAAPARAARAIHQASDRGERYGMFPRGDWCPTMGLIWPQWLVDRFLAWIATRPRIGLTADDGLIGAWLRQDTEAPLVRCAIPNLLDHPDDLPTIGSSRSRHRHGANPQRVSACQPEPDCDVHTLDWG